MAEVLEMFPKDVTRIRNLDQMNEALDVALKRSRREADK